MRILWDWDVERVIAERQRSWSSTSRSISALASSTMIATSTYLASFYLTLNPKCFSAEDGHLCTKHGHTCTRNITATATNHPGMKALKRRAAAVPRAEESFQVWNLS